MDKSPLIFVSNERGNTMMLSLMIVICSIFLAFVFFDVFSTYAYKNSSQKAADAAAIAAAYEAKDVYEEELANELEAAFQPFADGVWNLLENDEEESLSEEEHIRDIVGDMNFDKELPPSVLDKLLEPTASLANKALLFFFTDAAITDMMCDTIRSNKTQIEEKANYFAGENGAEEVVEITFPYEGSFEVFTSVKTETSYVTVPDEAFAPGQRDMHTEASASIPMPEGVSFVEGACD